MQPKMKNSSLLVSAIIASLLLLVSPVSVWAFWVKIAEEGNTPNRKAYYANLASVKPLYAEEEITMLNSDPFTNSASLGNSLAATETKAIRVIQITEKAPQDPELKEFSFIVSCPYNVVISSETYTYPTLQVEPVIKSTEKSIIAPAQNPWVSKVYDLACQENVWRVALTSYAVDGCETRSVNNPNDACFYNVASSCNSSLENLFAPSGIACPPGYGSMGWELREYTDVFLWKNHERINLYIRP